MKAVVRSHPLFQRAPGSYPAGATQLSPEQSDASSSGAYFRAVRPPVTQCSSAEPGLDSAKLDRLRFSIEADLWRTNSLLIAERMLDDAG
jgi:hypothetical protein